MYPVILLLAIFILIFLFWWWKYLPFSKFPNYIWNDWTMVRTLLFGTQVDRGGFVFQKINSLNNKHEAEGLYVLWFLTQPIVIVFGEEAIKFFSNESSLSDKPKIYDLFKFMGETAIFVSSGKRFKKTKRIMMPAFYPNVIKNIVPVMNHHAAALTETLAETKGEITDQIELILKNHTLRTFLEASMGIKADSEENKIKIGRIVDLFLKLLALAAYRLCSPWLHSEFMLKLFSTGREYAKLKDELDVIIKEVLEDIKEVVRSRAESLDSKDKKTQPKSLSEVLIEEHLKDPSSFDMDEVKNQVTGILTGGYDTTSSALMWCFLLLGNNQAVQQKAYEEVMSVTNGDVEFEDGRNLPYLESILKETLRLYPPAPVYGRTSSKDIKYGELTVPKDTAVAIYLYSMHRNPKIYPSPDDFIPERFLGDDSNVKPWTLIPFAEGVRSCIGKHFAMLEMKIVLVHVLRKFKIISLDRNEDIKLIYEIIFKNYKPLRMQFIPR